MLFAASSLQVRNMRTPVSSSMQMSGCLDQDCPDLAFRHALLASAALITNSRCLPAACRRRWLCPLHQSTMRIFGFVFRHTSHLTFSLVHPSVRCNVSALAVESTAASSPRSLSESFHLFFGCGMPSKLRNGRKVRYSYLSSFIS